MKLLLLILVKKDQPATLSVIAQIENGQREKEDAGESGQAGRGEYV